MTAYFGRQFIFVLDRSGSMSGTPWTEAVRALTNAINSLYPDDQFNVILFDDQQKYFLTHLTQATDEQKVAIKIWLDIYPPNMGTTNIKAPLQSALEMLNKPEASKHREVSRTLPFIVLITDGCVDDEKEICKTMSTSLNGTRLLTFGVGQW
jgi:uncharacterized protein with von Willebrand factor type A (vWA) domain